MSLMVTGRGRASVEWSGICTPSDGYRVLAANILLPAVNGAASENSEIVERSLSFLLSRRAEICFALLDMDSEATIETILKRNGLEIVRNGSKPR